MLFKRRERDDIRPLTGFKGFLYHFGRFLIFPLRRPFITIFILLVLFLAPTFRGVKPVNVPSWYAMQISKTYNKILIWWGTRQPEVSPGEFKFHPEEAAAPAPIAPSEFVAPEPQDSAAPNILDVLRGSSQQESNEVQPSANIEVKEEVVQEPINIVPNEPPAEVISPAREIQLPQDESLYFYPKDKKVYSLKYLDYPHEIIGKATVHDSNEIEINGEFIMMYGIYIHPYTAQGTRATQYLKDLIDNKEVKCGIVAYTEQNIATGICYYGEENINRTMVIKGYTKNVAL